MILIQDALRAIPNNSEGKYIKIIHVTAKYWSKIYNLPVVVVTLWFHLQTKKLDLHCIAQLLLLWSYSRMLS